MSSKENCKDSVLKYLKTQNRPYSANDVMQNLHKEFGKTAIQKALDDLSLEAKIREKVYGKQKVYSIVQEEDGDVLEMNLELTKLESSIVDTGEKLKAAEQELKKNETLLKELEIQPTNDIALQEKAKLEDTVSKLTEKIEALSSSKITISESEKNKIYSKYEKFSQEHRKRKRMCMDIINSILENFPKKRKDLLEEIGVELDVD